MNIITWSYKGKRYRSFTLFSPCPMCGAFALVELEGAALAEQPDDTTHVCLPKAGGCNHGFAKDK
jgi:hypothetical protein